VSQEVARREAKLAQPAVWTLLSSRGVRTATSGLLGLLLWEIVARYVIHNSLFLPTPGQVLQAGIELARSGEIFKHMRASASHFLIGSLAGFDMEGAIRDYAAWYRARLAATPDRRN
jgi:hypothetical protein